MIVFDLRCGAGHVFEAWLASSVAYEEQRASGLLTCPLCNSNDIDKAVMAPAVAPKGNQRRNPPEQAAKADRAELAPPAPPVPVSANLSPEARAEMERIVARMATAQAKALESSQWVGDRFTEEARAMHYGEREHGPIHGTASVDEAKALMEEGLPVAPLPFPVIPPGKRN